MNIKMMELTLLKEYENNPRQNDEAVDKVAESIKNFGFKVPIVVDKNLEIIAGHTRRKAALKLGIEKVPVIIADDLSDDQIKAFRLADNKVAEFSDWDIELLMSELEEIEMDMEDFGFEEFMSDPISIEDDEEDVLNDDIDDYENNNVSNGQVYQLGNHRLMCGDSTNFEHVNKLMDGKEADLLITDPPYNVSYEGKTSDKLTIQNDSMSDEDFREFLKKAFSTAEQALKKGGGFYIWHADSEGYNFRGACHGVGLTVKQCLIWNKNSMVMGRQDYHWKHEPCLYGWKDGASHTWNNNRKQTTVIEWDRPTVNKIHPTMKPVGLFEYQIKNSTLKGENVLDLFGGSGTTIIACENSKRNGYVMELDPKYVSVIIKRWEEYTGEKAVLLNG